MRGWPKKFFFAESLYILLKSNFLSKIWFFAKKVFFLPNHVFFHKSYEGTFASVKSLLSRDYMHHVDLSETRKSPKG